LLKLNALILIEQQGCQKEFIFGKVQDFRVALSGK